MTHGPIITDRATNEPDDVGSLQVVELFPNPYLQRLLEAAECCIAFLRESMAPGPNDAANQLQSALDAIAPAFGPIDHAQLVLNEVHSERGRQDAKWGQQNHELPHWMLILMEEVGEVNKAVLEREVLLRDGPTSRDPLAELDGRTGDIRTELIQVAAVAAEIVECMDRRASRVGVQP